MAAAPNESIPRQHEDWYGTKGTYRFLDNPKVTPERIQQTHRQLVREECSSHPVVLAIQDTTELDYTKHPSVKGLGPLSKGHSGLLQHSTLALTPSGDLLGILGQIYHPRKPVPKGETRKQRHARPKESDFWPNSVRAVGLLGPNTRVIHVTDRGGDSFEMMTACKEVGSGFLIRSQHDRYVNGGSTQLVAFMQQQPVKTSRDVAIQRHSAEPARFLEKAKPAQPARVARVNIRYAEVQLEAPENDPRFHSPMKVWAVYALEENPPAGAKPVEWLLLCSEPVEDDSQALACIDWYTLRWIIEEWHRVEKTGCRLELSQLKSAFRIECLGAFTGVIAVRLLQLRDLAQGTLSAMESGERPPRRRRASLKALVSPSWIIVVSHLARCRPEELTPSLFWLTVAKRGGFLARKRDGAPGWQAIWKGWHKVMTMVEGYELSQGFSGTNTYG